MACGGACHSGSGHGGLVMALMSTMVLGLKRRERERIRDNIIIIFNYTTLLQYHLRNKMVL